MKKEVKIICIVLSVLFLICICGCKKNPDVTVSSEIEEVVSSEQETVSEQASTPSEEVTAEPETPAVSPSVPTVPTPSYSSKPTVVTPAPQPTVSLGYEVLDPDNTRGLSEVRSGFGFGVATGGKPHSISINNQLKFDSLDNVSALALDTISTDKRMYLTFDCGYEYNNLTASVLDTLKAKNVKAAFFCTLDYLEDNPQLVKRMIDEGHIVGNHSATHPDFSTINRTKMANEIYLVDKYLKENFAYTSKYFRFPSGAHSDSALDLVTSVGHSSIFWSVAYSDWSTSAQPEIESAFNTVTSRYHSGAVILLHTVSATNNTILPRLIDKAIEEGYSLKTLDEYPGFAQ